MWKAFKEKFLFVKPPAFCGQSFLSSLITGSMVMQGGGMRKEAGAAQLE